MPAGYSTKALAQKLGIEPDQFLAFVGAPQGYQKLLGRLPEGARVVLDPEAELGLVQIFARDRAMLSKELPKWKARLSQDGIIWVAWPKRSSELRSDLSDVAVREVGLKNGLVDVKVCAIDESWSALKFVRRLQDRDGILHPTKKKA
jgi:hypothetical protein